MKGDPRDVETGRGEGKSTGINIDRWLLVVVAILQAGILIGVWIPRDTATVGQSPPAVEGLARMQQAPVAVSPAGRRPTSGVFLQDLSSRRFYRAFDEMDRVFENAFADFRRMNAFLDIDKGWDALVTLPSMDMGETDDRYIVIFTLSGSDPADMQVMLDDRLLSVYALLQDPCFAQRQVFERRVQLPGPVGDIDLAQAVLSNGVLKVSVPKSLKVGTVRFGRRRLL